MGITARRFLPLINPKVLGSATKAEVGRRMIGRHSAAVSVAIFDRSEVRSGGELIGRVYYCCGGWISTNSCVLRRCFFWHGRDP